MQDSERMLSFEDLPRLHQRGVYWSFLWRGLVITLCSMIGGAIAGFIVGLIASLTGLLLGVNLAAHPDIMRAIGGVSGFAIGCYACWHYLRWLFAVKLGHYRLRLVAEPLVPPNPSLERP